MSKTQRVAIRVDDAGQPVVQSAKVFDDLIMTPGVAYELEPEQAKRYAVTSLVATGTLVILGKDEDAPQPAPAPVEHEPTSNTGTAVDFLR